MSTNHEHGHAEETERLWQKSEQLPFIQGLKRGKLMEEIMAQLDTKKAFEKEPEELGCSDGRCTEHRCGVAGDLILASEDEVAEFVRRNKGKIRVVKSHDGCGAAAIKFKQIQEAGEFLPIGVTSSDQLAAHFSKELAEKLGAEYAHTSAAEMSGPVHNERAIYLDGTGKFNPGALKELPAGFMSSGKALGLSSDYIQKEIETLASIALGDHGFGQRFTKDNPFYVVVSAKDEDQLGLLMHVATKAARGFDGRVEVRGFIAK